MKALFLRVIGIGTILGLLWSFSSASYADDATPAKPVTEKPQDAHTSTKHTEKSMDDIMSFYQQGIVPKSKAKPKTSSKISSAKHNRVYTVGELLDKFGDPEERRNIMSSKEESWSYKCTDGTVFVRFLQVGYAPGSDKTKNLRLEIISFLEKRKPDKTEKPKQLEPK